MHLQSNLGGEKMEKSHITMKLKLDDSQREQLRKVASQQHRSMPQQVLYYIEQGIKHDGDIEN